jgi:hypothetical protein
MIRQAARHASGSGTVGWPEVGCFVGYLSQVVSILNKFT